MGTGNTVVKQWLRDKERFADLFNGQMFGGKQVILAKDLEPVDSEADILVTDKDGKTRELQRYRDIVMQWKKGPLLAILGCENQAKIHYTMPVRNMIYDGLSYIEQMRKIWEEHKNEAEVAMTSEEFLSKFLKTDKIYPVITLVLYYGTERWDASTDLQKIFGMLKYRSNKTELINYMQKNKAYFRNVDEKTYQVIREFLHSERILKKEVSKKKEAKIDMCQALEELYNDGIQQGLNKKLIEQVTKKLSKGKSVEEIAEALEETVETIKKIIKEIPG